MSNWKDSAAEEEWYASRCAVIHNELLDHVKWCEQCDDPRGIHCSKGMRIINQLTAMQENLRKVKLKNKLY